MAAEKGVTTAQLAIAGVIPKGHVPIPGTKKRNYVEENIAAAHITLTDSDMKQLEAIIPLDKDTDARYDESIMKHIDMK